MPTHVALLRGINVGGGGKLLMADLRRLVVSLGHADVATYIQSGNLIFTPSHADTAALAAELRAAIAGSHGVDPPVIVLSSQELAEVVSANPYPDEPVPKYVHCVFLPESPDQAAHVWIAEAAQAAAARGSADEAALIGRTLYVHTPDGFGTSDLAKTLLMTRSSPVATGTARNWSTVTKLLALCRGDGSHVTVT
jgi:uncharacterized protein (DUF1697 family)